LEGTSSTKRSCNMRDPYGAVAAKKVRRTHWGCLNLDDDPHFVHPIFAAKIERDAKEKGKQSSGGFLWTSGGVVVKSALLWGGEAILKLQKKILRRGEGGKGAAWRTPKIWGGYHLLEPPGSSRNKRGITQADF